MAIISAIKNNYGKYLAKGVGAAALYFVARDAHTFAKIQADSYMKTKNAEASHYYLNNALTLDKPSITKGNMQNSVLRYDLSHNFRGFVNSFIGYFKGLGASLVSDVVPMGLGLTALLAKNKTIAKASGLGLVGFATFSFIHDGLGIGKTNSARLPIE